VSFNFASWRLRRFFPNSTVTASSPPRAGSRRLVLEQLEQRLALYNPPPGLPPIISAIPEEVISPGAYSQPIGFFVSDPQEDQLLVTAAVSNPNPAGVLSNTDVVLSGFGDSRTVQIFDSEDMYGTATVTLTAYNDITRLRAQTSFTVALDVSPTLTLPQGYSYSQPFGSFPLTIPVNASSPIGRTLTPSTVVTGDSPRFDQQQQYQFTGVGYYTYGASAYVLHSDLPGPGVGGYYLIRPSDGALFAYDGSGSYAHSFTNNMALATLGPNVYTDPNLLLSSLPPEDYAMLQSIQQQYQFTGLGYFTAGIGSYVFQSAAGNNSFGNPYYLLTPTGQLYAYDGSGSYYHTVTNNNPLLSLGTNIYNYPSELINAEASPAIYNTLYPLRAQYDLQELNGSFYTNTYGNEAEWFYSPVLNEFGQHWYTLTPDGTLRAWEGYADSSVGAVIATLDPSVYANPTWLTTATALPNPAVGTSFDNSGNLIVNLPNPGYVGTFNIAVSVTDGIATVTQDLQVTSTGTTPTMSISQGITPIPPGSTQTVPHGSFPVMDTVAAPGATSETVTVSNYDPAFTLEQDYQFQSLGYLSAGSTAYVLQAAGNNSFDNPYFLLSSAGGLYAYDGSGSYAHTFANFAPITNLGSQYYSDPFLLLNARPAVNYTQLYSLQQQYQFQGLGILSAGASAYVLKADANNSFGNPYYLLAPGGGIYAYDGSGSYAHTIANVTPVANVDPDVYLNATLLTGAIATPGLYSQLAAIELQTDLNGLGYFTASAPAYVLTAPENNANGNPYYLLSPTGGLYAYDGSGSYSHAFANSANLVASLDPSVYNDPSLLTSAKAPVAATGVTATLSSGTLTLNAPTSFVGSFQVTVTATIGTITSTESFQVTSTDTAPAPNAISEQSVSLANPSATLTLGATDAENDPVTYTAAAVAYSPEYALQQQYRLQGIGMVTTPDGVTAYVLEVSGQNANGNPYYLLTSSGGLYAYDGSGSFSHTIANSANLIAQLSPSDYSTPTLITDAQPPATTTAIQGAVIAPSGNQLSINVTGLPVGTVFEVLVTASDGAETGSTSFLVTVTA
jgi:hypothetical protein